MRFTPTCSGADRRQASWFCHPSPCQRAVCVSASKQPSRPGRAHGQPWSQSRGQDSPWGAGAWTCLPPPTLGPTVNTPCPPLPAPQPPRETIRRPPSCLLGPRTRKVLNHAHTQQDVNGQMEKEAEWPHSPQGTQWRDQPLKVFENATPSPLQPQPGRRHRPWLQGVDRTKGAQRKAGPLPTVPSHPQVPPASGHWGGGGVSPDSWPHRVPGRHCPSPMPCRPQQRGDRHCPAPVKAAARTWARPPPARRPQCLGVDVEKRRPFPRGTRGPGTRGLQRPPSLRVPALNPPLSRDPHAPSLGRGHRLPRRAPGHRLHTVSETPNSDSKQAASPW